MTITLNIAGDFEDVCGDFHASVVLRVGNVDVTLPKTLNTPYTIRELEPTGAQVLRKGTLFAWSRSRSTEPPVGSIIMDPYGTYWTIYRLENVQHVETYEAFCLNLNIVTAAVNAATVLKGSYVKGRAGEAKAVWKGLWSGATTPTSQDTVEARFQPSEETARLEFGAESSLEVYRVYFESPVPMDLAGGEYRLVDSQGFRYRVVKYFNENRIDRLPVAIATRITDGKEYWAIDAMSGDPSP